MFIKLQDWSVALLGVILLWSCSKSHADICEEPFENIFCRCEETVAETSVTCFIFGKIEKDNDAWKTLGKVDNVVALTLRTRLPVKMEYIPKQSLKRLSHLKSFTFQEGSLGDLESYAISYLKNLRSLMLERNEITVLKRHAIYNCTKLKKLALSENFLTELLAESIHGLPELEQLFLDRNNITRIESCAFCDLHNLRELDLWGNQLTDLTEYTFRGLRFLKRLDLYKNKIRIINDKVFQSMPKLIEIDLKSNLIDHISSRAFHNLTKLQRLTLNENNLKILPDDVFKCLPNLRSVDLYNNQLETLQANVIENMDNGKEEHFSLLFRENPLICDCSLQWITTYLELNKSHQFTRELEETKCRSDKEDGDLAIVHKLNMTCESLTTKSRIIQTTSLAVSFSTDKTPIELQLVPNKTSIISGDTAEDEDKVYLSDRRSNSAWCVHPAYLSHFLIVGSLLTVRFSNIHRT